MTASASVLNLVFRVDAHICALPLPRVAEILRPVPVEPLAGAPAGVRGMAIVRGAAVPVIDLAALLGGRGTCSRFVMVRAGERRLALAVDAVLGIRAFAAPLWSDLPPLLRDACQGVIEAVAALDQEAVLALQSANLVPPAVWESLPAGEA